jgi:hypothetical protein
MEHLFLDLHLLPIANSNFRVCEGPSLLEKLLELLVH